MMGSSLTPDSYCSRCHGGLYHGENCHCPTTCTLCKGEIKTADKHGKGKCVPSDAEQRAVEQAEQAFWDAVVARFVARYAGSGTSFGAVIHDTCDMADALVAQRRKRIAARAKGG